MSFAEIVRLKNSVTDRDHASGAATAPVTLLEYGNFQCIDCGRFVFRNFPSVRTHPHSLRAAEAAEAAGAQGKFWEMHDELFAHQENLEDNHLSRYASRIGLDLERFNHDMAEHTFLKQIEADYKLSLFDEHVNGTPTLYINEVRYVGATDAEGLLHAIKEADLEGRIRLPPEAQCNKRVFGQTASPRQWLTAAPVTIVVSSYRQNRQP